MHGIRLARAILDDPAFDRVGISFVTGAIRDGRPARAGVGALSKPLRAARSRGGRRGAAQLARRRRQPSPGSARRACRARTDLPRRRMTVDLDTRGTITAMSEPRTMSLLPWQVTLDEFTQKAAAGPEDGACCAFVVDPSIPQAARGGYASLVMAYSRADEPVCVLDDGAALVLVMDGGIAVGKGAGRARPRADGPPQARADPHRRRGADRRRSHGGRCRSASRRNLGAPRERSAPRTEGSRQRRALSAAAMRFGNSSRRSCSSVLGSGIDQLARATSPGMFGRRSARHASSRVATTSRLGARPERGVGPLDHLSRTGVIANARPGAGVGGERPTRQSG